MKALTHHSANNVRVENIPDPILRRADDILLRITVTAICGSDLHLYRGKVPGMKGGDILGHEFMGIIEEIGSGVAKIEPGDRFVIPFTIACGDCFFCERKLFSACETTNPKHGFTLDKKDLRSGAGLFGFTHLNGDYAGGQAEFDQVPKANVGPLVIPPRLAD